MISNSYDSDFVTQATFGTIGHHFGTNLVPRFGTLTKVSQQCIEERIAGIVSDKRALFKGVFEGSSDQIDFERSSVAARPSASPEQSSPLSPS